MIWRRSRNDHEAKEISQEKAGWKEKSDAMTQELDDEDDDDKDLDQKPTTTIFNFM